MMDHQLVTVSRKVMEAHQTSPSTLSSEGVFLQGEQESCPMQPLEPTDISLRVTNYSEVNQGNLEQDHRNDTLLAETNSVHIQSEQPVDNQPRMLLLASQPVLSSCRLENFSNKMPSILNPTFISEDSSVTGAENSLQDEKYFGICRICANESVKTVALFLNEGITLGLVEKIQRCLPIEVSASDGLPQQICNECTSNLQICDDFINLSVAGNEKLKAMILNWSQLEMKSEACSASKESFEEATVVISEEHDLLAQKETAIQTVDLLFSKADGSNDDDGIIQHKVPNAVCEKPIQDSEKSYIKVRQWSCSECDYKASRQSSLSLHQKIKHQNELEQTRNKNSKEETFMCEYCDMYFNSELKWKKHVTSHRNAPEHHKEIACSECDEKLPNFKKLQEHLRAVHNMEQECKYSCDKCDKSYRLASSLDIHQATHSNETPYLCDICGKGFKHGSNLRCHKRSHGEGKLTHRHACDLCPKSFPSKFHLSEHKNVHLNVTPYSCVVCGKRFHRRIQLRQHRIIHNSESSYECPHCGACFNRRGNMTQHMKRHLKERKFTCKVCMESFQTLSEVVQHRRRHTEKEPTKLPKVGEDYSCCQCQGSFPCSSDLEEHARSQCPSYSKSDTKFQCGICSKLLSNRRTLDYHIRSFHTQDRPFPCQYCAESFLSREACTVHERLHTGEKPYSCSECQMSFRCSSNLSQHLRTHRDERPWACDHCPKSFKRKGILLVHMRTHTGEKPFCCDICGRRFTQKNDMLKHQQTHTSAKQTFVCGECNWAFTSRKELNKHRRTHHMNSKAQSNTNCVSALTSHSQTLLITDDFCQFPITIIEEGSNVIVHQIDDIGKQTQIVEVNSSESNSQIVQFSDALLQSVIPESQILAVQATNGQHMIQLENNCASRTNLSPATEQNWQS